MLISADQETAKKGEEKTDSLGAPSIQNQSFKTAEENVSIHHISPAEEFYIQEEGKYATE